MKKIVPLLTLILSFSCGEKPKESEGFVFLKKMHEKYYQAPCRAYTFSQKNSHYRNDSLIGNSEWHEAVEFPDKFRIGFGQRADSDFVIFMNDSAFNFRSGQLMKARVDSNTLLLLLGGMYYRDFND